MLIRKFNDTFIDDKADLIFSNIKGNVFVPQKQSGKRNRLKNILF